MAIQNTPRTSQLRQRTDLQNLGQQADKFVSEIHDAIDKELDSPLKLYASFPTPNARLNFKSSVIESADESNKVASPVKKQLFNSLTNPWINFQDQTVSNAADFDIVFPASTVGFFRHVGFTLIGSGKIKALFSAEAATEGALSNAGALFVSGGLPLGYVTLECTNVAGYFKTAGSATNIIENAKIFRFGAGAGGGGGTSSNGTGAEVIDLRFRAEIQDSFSEIPSDETPVDISSNKTDASLHDVANELYRLSYDASKTVTGSSVTNLLQWSEEANDAYWTKFNTTITANAILAPNRTLTADKLVEDNSLNSHRYSRVISFTSGITYTLSAYVKAAERTSIVMRMGNASEAPFPIDVTARFNLATGTIANSSASVVQSSIENIGNGWWRCSISAIAAATSTALVAPVVLHNETTTVYTGDGVSGVFTWGAQLNEGPLAGYIPTTSATANKNLRMTLNSAPSFTLKVGDVVVVNDESRAITGMVSQTDFNVEDAFSPNPSSAACCVSQVVYTKDLNGFDANGTGLAVSSQITDNVNTVMVNYEDSLTLGDVIPDWGTNPHIAYQVTADNLSWSDRKLRTVNLNGEVEAVFSPNSYNQFRTRFFANKTSGSGGVNLLGFKAFWHEQIAESLGEDYHVAFARPTDAVYQNVSHSVEGGKSRFTFSFSYGRGAFGGEASGSALDVYVNGQLIPRYESGVVDETQAYFKEISDSVIEMDTDYSASGLEFMFKVPRLILDSRESNSSRITDLEEITTPLNYENANGIINGSFEFWQRGTSFPAAAAPSYAADRWQYTKNGTMIHTISRSTDVPLNAFGQYSILLNCTTVDSSITGTDLCHIRQHVEGNFIRRFRNKNVVLKFWVKATKTGISCVSIRNSAVNRSLIKEYTINASNTWEQKTIRFNFDTTGTWLYDTNIGMRLEWNLATGPTLQTTPDTWQAGNFLGTANQVNHCDTIGNNFQLADVHFCLDNEAQNKDPEFQLAGRDLAEEFQLCQRYYETITQSGSADLCFAGRNASTTQNRAQWFFKIDKRAVPSMSTDSFAANIATSTGSLVVSAIAFTNTSTKFANLLSTIAGATSGTVGNVQLSGGTIIADAEL
jgi:hypothetical protein